jgi:glycosyltransferase involved in cell wall biosynthesis
MKIALVHEWFETYAGSERVVEQILHVFPEVDLFSVVDFLPSGKRDFILNKNVTTTFIQTLPFAKKKFRLYLPLMPLAVEQLDLSGYDLVISSSHAVAKGVITGPDQFHICYCHSPIRYAWDLQHQYLRESGLAKGIKGWFAKYFLHKLRIWDLRTIHGVDSFISNSKFISRRIFKVYGRNSTVIYPPVSVKDFQVPQGTKKSDYYITSSRMTPYKRIDLIVETFTKKFSDQKLVVIGDGPEFEKIKNKAGDNVELLGYQSFSALKEKIGLAKAFIFAAEEDFGIAPVEAQAAGIPVIAFGKGGALETIRGLEDEMPTGVFFYEQTVDALTEAIELFESNIDKISYEACVENAHRFTNEQFRNKFKKFVDDSFDNWQSSQ